MGLLLLLATSKIILQLSQVFLVERVFRHCGDHNKPAVDEMRNDWGISATSEPQPRNTNRAECKRAKERYISQV